MDARTSTRIAWFLFVAFTSSQALGAIGKTDGSADVSQTGEANYSIPIFAPPGTHGMAPQLAIVYGHRSGSTLLGAGWGLAGLSQIARCPRIWAADGEARDVRNDYSDRFCLDGNKLRLVSGTYGNPSATYQTEIETFARITSYGTAGNGPTHFIVERKDGLIYEYGNTANSRIESVGQATARTWALNQIRDRSGNAINFTYFEDMTNGAYRIDSVQYTSNPGQGLNGAYEIDFIWETKPSNEIDSGYIAGSIVKQITRLDRVDVKYNTTTLVRRYELTYQGALSSTSKSRLASIQECAGPTPDCLPATTFSYQNGTSGLGSEASTGVNVPTTPWPMDVNGDGRDDLVYSSSVTSGSGTWMVMFANSSGGFNTPVNTGVTNTNYTGAIPIDYNADGLEDLLVPYSGGTWWVMIGSASGLASPVNTSTAATGTGSNARAFDVNGDGLDDLVWADLVGYAGGDTVRYRTRVLSGTFSSTVSTLVSALPADTKMETGVFGQIGQPGPRLLPDLNGDGRPDFIYRQTRRVWDQEFGIYRFFHPLVAVATGSWTSQVGNPDGAAFPSYGDFNGDGKTDLLFLNDAGSLTVRFSKGTSLGLNDVAVGSGGSGWAVLDWDGDGYDDVLYNSSGTWFLRRATGEGFAAAVSTGLAASGTGATIMDLNGDGLYDLGNGVNANWKYRPHAGSCPDLLVTATDGFGIFATFSYASLANYSSYSKQTGAAYPLQDFVGPVYVVSNVANSNGIGGAFNLQSFYYQGARTNLQGRGFLGFEYRSWIDSRDGTAQRRSFRQDFPYIGAVTNARRTQEPSGTAISEIQTTYSTYSYGSGFETRSFPFASTITSYDREAGGTFNGALMRTSVRQMLVDSATGTPYDVTTTTTEPVSGANGIQPGASYVQRVYSPTALFSDTPSTWCRGRPGETQVINSHNQFGGGSITRTTNVTWDTTACRPTQVVEESGNSLLQVTRTLGYDAFGNVNSDSVAGIGMTARTTTANWGTTGQFPTSVTNALSQTTNKSWNFTFGTQASETDPNGVVVSWSYDDFGRPTREDRPDGTATTWDIGACVSPSFCGDSKLRYFVTTSRRNTSNTLVRDDLQYFDAFGRLLYNEPELVDGNRSVAATRYDALGRIAQRSAPYFSGGTVYWTTFAYDLRNRATSATSPISDSSAMTKATNFYYEGLTTRVVDPQGKQTTKVSNVAGASARSIDHDGYYQTFDYDSFGNVVRVMDSLINTLQSNTFNIRGMRTAQTDMDAGSWTFTPDALGEITSQTDAKSQNSTFVYDKLGRLTSRTELEGTSTFTFGTSAAAKNIGRLASMSGPGYSESYVYDSIGRPQTGTITSDATYAYGYTYNAIGSIDTLTYPVSTAGYRLKLQYDYQNGQLLRVKDFNAPTTVFWQANAADAWGNIIDETLGNGVRTVRGFDLAVGVVDYIQSGPGGGSSLQDMSYTWDLAGNLTQRQNVGLSLTEGFGYDNLYRLSSVTGPDPMTIGYDSLGNITSKTGVGTYAYHATKKHQVTAAGANTYGYDANGNVNSRNGLSTTWYSYNLPNTINGPSSNSSQFFYGPDRKRWKQVASYGGTSEQTIYVGGMLEKVTLGADTHWKHYIAGTTGVVAEYIRHSTGTNETVYLLRDHLGSTEMITNSSGAQMSRLSYDSWGRRRNGGTWTGNPAASAWTTITDTTRHGFTSHEMLDNLNLVHMNGRVYDQIIGRFMSADPSIDGASNTQGWNRYAYVANNPLSAADPTGYTRDRPNVRPRDGGHRRCAGDWGGPDGTTISPCAEAAYQAGVDRFLQTWGPMMSACHCAPMGQFSGQGWFQFMHMGGFQGPTGAVRPQAPASWVWTPGGQSTITEADGSPANQQAGSGDGYWTQIQSFWSPLALNAPANLSNRGGTNGVFHACAQGVPTACMILQQRNSEDLDAVMSFLRRNYSDELSGDLPSISFNTDVDFWKEKAGNTGLFSGDIQLAANYASRADLAGTLFHELLHSKSGFWGRWWVAFTDFYAPIDPSTNLGAPHTAIMQRGLEVRDAYRKEEGE
jgi:RHS repeat-associated protein